MSFAGLNEQILTFSAGGPLQSASRTVAFAKAPRALTIKNAYAASQSGQVTAQPLTSFLSASLIGGGALGTSTLTIATFGSAAPPYAWTANQGYAATWATVAAHEVAEGSWIVWRDEGATTREHGGLTCNAHVVLGTGLTSA